MITNRSACLFIITFFLLFFNTNLKSENLSSDLIKSSFDNGTFSNKIYIEFDEIIFTSNGMFIVLEDNIFSLNQINHDKNGYYMSTVTYKKCDNGHPQVCLACHGCRDKHCLYRCCCGCGPTNRIEIYFEGL